MAKYQGTIQLLRNLLFHKNDLWTKIKNQKHNRLNS